MPKRLIQWIAVACALLIFAGACSNNGGTKTSKETKPGGDKNATAGSAHFDKAALNKAVHEGTPQRGGTMTFGLESDVLQTSPNDKIIQPADVQLANAVFDSLIYYGDDGNPVTDNTDHAYNQLADSITSSNGLKTWTLKLRPNVKFSNGKPVTAQQVVDHTMWIKASTSCSCAADAKNILSVTAPDALTVVYTLENPVVTFPGKLNNTGLGWITESGARGTSDTSGPLSTDKLVGAGPFVFQSKAGDSYTLTKNTNYYGVDKANDDAPLPYLDKIVFRPLGDSVTRLQAVQSNGVQIMQTADTSNLKQARDDKNLSIQPSEGSSATILVLNLTKPPFGVAKEGEETDEATAERSLKDPTALAARQAFNYAINRNEINEKYYKGWRQPAYGFLPKSNPWFSEKGQLPRQDVEKAKALIKQVKDAGGTTDVEALCINTPEATGIFQILKDQATAVGIDATLNQVEQAKLVEILLGGQGDWQVACFRSPQIADADGFYNAVVTGQATNLVKYSRTSVDQAMNSAREIDDFAERKKLYDGVQEQLAKDVVYVPLLFDLYGNVFRNNVSGLSTPSAGSLGIIRPGDLYYMEK